MLANPIGALILGTLAAFLMSVLQFLAVLPFSAALHGFQRSMVLVVLSIAMGTLAGCAVSFWWMVLVARHTHSLVSSTGWPAWVLWLMYAWVAFCPAYVLYKFANDAAADGESMEAAIPKLVSFLSQFLLIAAPFAARSVELPFLERLGP